MQTQISKEYSHVGPRDLGAFQEFMAANSALADADALRMIGVGFDTDDARRMIRAMELETSAMDTALPNLYVTAASVTNPIQFLQSIVPGVVRQIVAARKIDELAGITMVGDWEDEQIVFRRSELAGTAVPYHDMSPVPYASWNMNFETRNIARNELGLRVDFLEEKRAAKMLFNSAAEKREAVIQKLEALRNSIGFYGFNNGANRTFGFLNDPSLPAYVTVAPSATTGNYTFWANKTFLEITADIRTAVAALRTQLGGNLDEDNAKLVLAVGTAVRDRLTVTSDFGMTVRKWVDENYAGMRIVTAQELNAANGGQNVFYLYLETIPNDISTDNGRVFDQLIQTKFAPVGVSRQTKHYEEDYTNASAGTVCKRPVAVYRGTGI